MFLADKHADTAKKFMTDLIDIHENVFERADDSNGFIGGFFRTCVEDLGKIYAKLPIDAAEVVDVVYNFFIHNDYAIADEVIFDFKDASERRRPRASKGRIHTICFVGKIGTGTKESGRGIRCGGLLLRNR
jgi:hypothetical protein